MNWVHLVVFKMTLPFSGKFDVTISVTFGCCWDINSSVIHPLCHLWCHTTRFMSLQHVTPPRFCLCSCRDGQCQEIESPLECAVGYLSLFNQLHSEMDETLVSLMKRATANHSFTIWVVETIRPHSILTYFIEPSLPRCYLNKKWINNMKLGRNDGLHTWR